MGCFSLSPSFPSALRWDPWVCFGFGGHGSQARLGSDLGTARTQKALLELVTLRSLLDSASRVGGPSRLPEIPSHLRIDPTTRQPFLILNLHPAPCRRRTSSPLRLLLRDGASCSVGMVPSRR